MPSIEQILIDKLTPGELHTLVELYDSGMLSWDTLLQKDVQNYPDTYRDLEEDSDDDGFEWG